MEFLTEIEIECPSCGEATFLQLDTSEGNQTLIEDCSVCCRPIQIDVRCVPGEVFEITATEG